MVNLLTETINLRTDLYRAMWMQARAVVVLVKPLP